MKILNWIAQRWFWLVLLLLLALCIAGLALTEDTTPGSRIFIISI